MPTSLTAQQIVDAFNNLVRQPIVSTYPAQWSAGVTPNIQGTMHGNFSNTLGSATEPAAKVAADLDLPRGESAVANIYYQLHQWAMELTKIRAGRYVYYQGVTSHQNRNVTVSSFGVIRMAIQSGLELYFPIPQSPPNAGTVVTLAMINSFCNALKTAVENRRNGNSGVFHVIGSHCHSSCHSSCHGSRGRR